MRTRIIIDTQDAEDCPDMPFTLNVHRDDDEGDQSRNTIDIGSETCLIGNDIPAMLRELADKWEAEPLDAIDRGSLDQIEDETDAMDQGEHILEEGPLDGPWHCTCGATGTPGTFIQHTITESEITS